MRSWAAALTIIFAPGAAHAASVSGASSFEVFNKLALACNRTPEVAMDGAVTKLEQCTPRDQPKNLRGWVQQTADALGYAGHPPTLRRGAFGPHVSWVSPKRILAATFVVNDEGSFDVWLSEQLLGTFRSDPLPPLPQGAELLSSQEDASGRKMVVIALKGSFAETGALRSAVLSAIGAELTSDEKERALRADASGGGAVVATSGKVRWNGGDGWFEATPLGPRHTSLAVYVKPHT